MRQVIMTVNVYSFSELSPSIQKNLIESERDSMIELRNEDIISDVFKPYLTELGLPTRNIHYSLNSCQGDGVAFYGNISADGRSVLIKKLIEAGKIESISDEAIKYIELSISCNNHRYSHHNTMILDMRVTDERCDVSSKDLDKLELCIKEFINDVSWELEKRGYEYLDVSDEKAKGELEDRGLEYLANGSVYDC